MTTIDQADIYAILEERPYQLDELATLLEQPADAVAAVLADMGIARCEKCRAAFLRKPSTSGRFCSRLCYEDGKPSLDGATVLAKLQAGPLGPGALAAALGVCKKTVQKRLSELGAAGQVKSHGRGTHRVWALASWTPAPSLQPQGVIPEREKLLGDRGRRIYPTTKTHDAAGAPLRQKPPAATGEGSWWIGLSREQLNAGAIARGEAMRGSKEHLQVPLRLLK